MSDEEHKIPGPPGTGRPNPSGSPRPLPEPGASGEVKARAKEPAGTGKEEREGEKEKKAKEKDKKKNKKDKEGLGSSRGIETMFRTSYRQHVDLSSLADNKANIMISINGIIISVIIASISPKIDANPWLLLPTAVLLLGCLISMVFAILAARPRVSSRLVTIDEVRSDATNILFFGNFVNLREDDYVTGMVELMQDTERLYLNMIRDIYGLGKVLARKFRLLRWSYSVFMAGLVFGVLLFLLVFVGVVATPEGIPATGP